jgi:hypothetical protein
LEAFWALLAMARIFVARRLRSKLLWGVVTMVLLAPAGLVLAAFYPELVDARFRTYKAFYRDLHQGMTRDEVLATLDKHYPAGGARKRPKMSEDEFNLGFFMDPEHSREPNCEGIFLKLNHGHVESLTYSPD